MEFRAYIMEISEYVSSKVSCSLPFGQVGFPAAQLTASQNILPIFCFSQTRYKRYIDNSHLKRHESMHVAAAFGLTRFIKNIIQKGYSISERTSMNEIPLHLALKSTQVDKELLKILLKTDP